MTTKHNPQLKASAPAGTGANAADERQKVQEHYTTVFGFGGVSC